MGLFDFFKKKKRKSFDKIEFVKKYKLDDDLPETINTMSGGPTMYKKDMTGLMAYLKKMNNMERLFNELTYSIRNGCSVKKYLEDAQLIGDEEIMSIAAKGFDDIAGFLEDMLEINENSELRKDFNACIEAKKILQQTNH